MRPPRDRLTRLRTAGNLFNLSTPLGLLVARVGRATTEPGPRGLVLASGYRLPFPVAGAFTVGDVVITPHAWDALRQQRPGLLEHEEAHSWQWFCCAGLPFLPLYGLALGWSVLRSGHLAAHNVFERGAGLERGGYPAVAARPLLPAVRARLVPLVGSVRRGRRTRKRGFRSRS